jgi:hypothetical protein
MDKFFVSPKWASFLSAAGWSRAGQSAPLNTSGLLLDAHNANSVRHDLQFQEK